VENVIATDDTDMAEANSVNPINSIETTERVITESDRRAEQIIAKSDRRAEQIIVELEFVDEFGDTPVDEFDIDIEPHC
jgi:hypothetical protein